MSEPAAHPAPADDASSILADLRAGRRDVPTVVEEHLARLVATRTDINAAVETLAERARGEAPEPPAGPLSGLPISVKETFALAGHEVTAGSRRMPPVRCHADAAAVALLRDAGAIVVARGNVPEFAMAGETDNPRYGRSNNPLAVGRTCGGSSGGDAALVAAGAVAAGLGSDILGSIRIPAAFCGLVGFKPASRAVSKADMWPDLEGLFVDSWMAAGPITRSVRDARLLYGVLAGQAPAPPASPGGLRLIEPRGFPWRCRDAAIPRAVDAARRHLIGEGLTAESRRLGNVSAWYRAMTGILGCELLPELKRRLATADGRPFSLLQESLHRTVGRGTLYAGLYRLLLVAPLVRYRRAASLRRAIAMIESARREVRDILGTDGVLLLPTLGVLAPLHGAMNRLSLRPGFNPLLAPTSFCNYLDLPAVTVPAWRYRDAVTGLAPGVMLVAAPGAEGPLLDAAASLERGIGIHAQT